MTHSTVVTYLLWLTLGWFGVHHFYLGRDRHAFVWLWTLGGFGLGWLVEAVHLGRYIRTSDMEEKYESGELPYPDVKKDQLVGRRRPPFGIRRFMGELFFGYLIGTLLMAAVPEEIGETYYHVLTSLVGPAGGAIAIHTVANIGVEQCDLVLCFFFSYFSLPFLLLLPKSYTIGILSKGILFASIAINYDPRSDEDDEEDDEEEEKVKKLSVSYLRRAWSSRGKRYRRTRPARRRFCRRLAIIAAGSSLLLICVASALYFNAYVTTDYGERILLRVALDNLFKSPAWLQFKDVLASMATKLWHGGATEFFEQLIAAFDPEGELHAYKVLNLTTNATEKEISDRYKTLVMKFHPDRFPNVHSDEKKKIELRFIEVQQAYERVSTIKTKRMIKNRRTEL